MQTVIRIFGTYRQVTFRQSARIRETVLQAGDGRQVITAPVGSGVPARTEITLTSDMLDSGIGGDEMFVIRREPVERQRTGVDVMTELFGYVRLVRLEVKIITAPTEIGGVMVFGGQFAIRTGLEEDACAGCRST